MGNAAAAAPWEFWIDAGGTFTDCLARRPDDGTILTHKLLSTGRYPGTAGVGSDAATLLDPAARGGDPPGFYAGWTLTVGGVSRRVANSAPGRLELAKPLPLTPPAGTRYELGSPLEAPAAGVRWLLGLPGLDAPLPSGLRVRLGTTRATNALLERRGARTAFVTTAGFADTPLIGHQDRPDLFDLAPAPVRPLHEATVELDERLDAAGNVLRPLSETEVRAQLTPLRAAGVEALAVCLLHAHRDPRHEELVARVAAELGFAQVSLSSRLCPLPKFIHRADTALADAYLTPVLRAYADRLAVQLPGAELRWMTSAGGLARAESFSGKDAILSGPAGGVLGASAVGGGARIVALDMGGTSTDVSLLGGGDDADNLPRRYEVEVPAGGGGKSRPLRLLTPMLEIETVAAGGGSVCFFDGQKPAVGPRSAGADPGPACYGHGGPLCVTDVNCVLGKLPRFPFALDRAAALARLDALIAEIAAATGKTYGREELAAGFVRIANANMAEPVHRLAAARGDDLRARTLVPFGGAGGQHACALARELGIARIVCSPFAGALSALGIGLAPVTALAQRAVGRMLGELSPAERDALFAPLDRETADALTAEGVTAPARRTLELRYAGQETRLSVPADALDPRADFENEHHLRYGFVLSDRAVEVYAVRVERSAERDRGVLDAPTTHPQRHDAAPDGETRAWFDGHWQATPLHDRARLQPGAVFSGPAIVLDGIATVVVEPGWTAVVAATGDLLLEQSSGAPPVRYPLSSAEFPDPVELELFHQRFASVAAQMGAALRRAAISVNVKERLDFSCAVFDADGALVANAPHIPVHLGAMGECVRLLRADVPDVRPGDVLISNDPFRGGSHLPDITVATPVWDAAGENVLFWTASRAHHAEIGGTAPGSMPPDARTLAEEGVLLRAVRHRPGEPASEERLRRLFLDAPFPSRHGAENLADLRAQVAANAVGVGLLTELVARHGAETLRAYAVHLRQTTAAKMRAALAKLPPGERHAADTMDDGTPVCVTITLRPDAPAVFDFTGSGPVHPGNLNANPAIVASAVTYVLRCLLAEPIPLNAGLLDAVQIILPPGSLLDPPGDPDPARSPAVAGGNVETSQRVVDVLLGALGLAAGSQGTMNNLLFGEKSFGYYETIGGGAGATPAANGASALHTHLTNTRLTDPETLEARYPVRLWRWEIRRGSGGTGRQCGGDGMVRELEFLAPVTVSLLTSHRRTRPAGLAGGKPGAAGRNLLRRNGQPTWTELPPTTGFAAEPGDRLRLETPGGGGWGDA